MEYLKKTDGCVITHTQDTGIWKDIFPILLMQIRDECIMNKPLENDNMKEYQVLIEGMDIIIKTFNSDCEKFLFEPIDRLPELCNIIESKTNDMLSGITGIYDYAVVVGYEVRPDNTCIINDHVVFKIRPADSFVYVPYQFIISSDKIKF